MPTDADDLVAALAAAGVTRGAPVAIALSTGADGTSPGVAGIAVEGRRLGVGGTGAIDAIAAVERVLRPRWVWWASDTARLLVAADVRVALCWDLAAVHRVLHGGWRADEHRVWSGAHGLDVATAPSPGRLDLGGGDSGDGDHPAVRADGHLRAEWVDGVWQTSPDAAAQWAEIARRVHDRQHEQLAALSVGGDAFALARSESAAEVLGAELEHDGLPIDVTAAEALIAAVVGPRPTGDEEASRQRAERDAAVLRHAPFGTFDLRNPADVKELLRRAGIDVPDTRAWRLEALRDAHPVVDALLQWRKAERLATTFGYGWLDGHVGDDNRLRGAWTASDGAAGRMTAQAGLHNMPAELRPAVRADPGWSFVRADLGQIEPRVLAAVSGDRALVQATSADDLYTPIAERLRVDRPTAKVAVLAAMYGQTSGAAGRALASMDAAYPVAMQYLRDAERAGREGRALRTFGGRLLPLHAVAVDEADDDPRVERSVLSARGRYVRNAMVQGAAAELFKAWAVTVRSRLAGGDAHIVLCLHDELLVHAPSSERDRVAAVVAASLDETAARWFRASGVRFVADVRAVDRWADAKA